VRRDRAFEEKLRHGRLHEADLVLVLRQKNFFVTPTGDIANGGAPKLLGPNGMAIVLPDVEAYRDAKCHPFELKTKSIATFTRRSHELEHGFSLRLYREYLEYQKVTGRKLIIAVKELRTGELLARTLDAIGEPHLDAYGEPRISEGGPMGDMVFIPRRLFRVFHQGPACDLPLFAGVPVPPSLPTFEPTDGDA
jgi:hypothetical protein